MKKNKIALTVATTVMLLGSGSFALAQPTVSADAPQASFNIAKCGAKANDPNFDNGPIISQLIDKLPATGGIIKIPAGTYYIKTPIKIDKSFVTIEGVNDGWRSGVDPANSNGKESGGSHIELVNKNMDGIDVHSADSHRLSGDEFRDLNIEGQSSTGVGINVQSDNDHTVIQGSSMKNLGTDIINKGADCTRIVDNQLAESRNNIAMTGASQQAEIEHNQLGAQPGGIGVMMENPSNYAVNSNLIYPDGSSDITLYNPSHGTVWGNTLSSYTTGLINVLPNAQGNKGNANVIASNQVTINAYHKNGYATNGLPATLNWGAIHDENYRDLINHNVIEMNTPSGTAGIVMNSSQGTRAQDNIVTDNNTAAVNNTVPSPAAPTVSANAGNSGTTNSPTTKPTNSSQTSPAAKPSAVQPTKPATNTPTTKPATTTSSATKPTVSSSSEPSESTTTTGTGSSSTIGNVIPTNPAAHSSSATNKPSASLSDKPSTKPTNSSHGVTNPATTTKPTSSSDSQSVSGTPSGSTSSGSVTAPNTNSGSSVAPTGNGNTIPVNTDKPAANHGSTSTTAKPSATTSSSATNSSSSSSTNVSGTSNTNEPSAIPVTGGGSTNSDTGSSTGSSSLPIGGGTTATTDHATPSDTPVVQPSDDDTPSTTGNSSVSTGVSGTPSVTTPDISSSVTDGNTIPDNPLSDQPTNGGGTTATTASVKPASDPNGIVDTGNAISASSSGKKESAKTSSTGTTTKPTVKSSSVKATVEHSSVKSSGKYSGSSSLTPAEKDRSFLMSQVEVGNRNKDKDAMMSQGSSSMESSSSRTNVKLSKKHSHENSMMNQQSSSLVTNNGANGGVNANATGNSNGTPAFVQTGGTTKVSHNWLYNLIYGLFNKSTK